MSCARPRKGGRFLVNDSPRLAAGSGATKIVIIVRCGYCGNEFPALDPGPENYIICPNCGDKNT